MKLSLHHSGILVKDIPKAAAQYVQRFGYQICSPVIHDPVQTAFVQFLKLEDDLAYVELISPDGPESKLSNALKKGGGLNHLCYKSLDIEESCRQMYNSGMLLLQLPIVATAFPGRRIAWLMASDGIPIELVEQGEDKWEVKNE